MTPNSQYGTLSIPLHISRDYTARPINEEIIQRGPLSKGGMSDIKSLFWSEMKQNFNVAPSTTYVRSLLQDKLIKDQWELYVYCVCLSRLEGTSANVMHLYQQYWYDYLQILKAFVDVYSGVSS